MKNRLSTMGKSAKWMLVLLAACGVASSCKDDYTLDDEKPSWLNSSIYESLESQGNYTYYLRLVADPDVNPTSARPLSEVLSRTGSQTVFVADDEAWEAFFAKNKTLSENDPWHTATSYENLSVSQKKLLIHSSMLNNAIVMENLSSEQNKDGDLERGKVMRRETRVVPTDSITWLPSSELPINYNKDDGEKDYWSNFRTVNGGKGLYLVTDSTPSQMVFFTNEFMKNNNITDDDFKYFTNQSRSTEDVHIQDAKLISKDGVCQNGYVNKTEKVITPLPSMAEALRADDQTKIFSHMLERWSAPFFNNGVTEGYKDVMAERGITWTDSIFTKRYFSDISYPGSSTSNTGLLTDPNGELFKTASSTTVALTLDPAWNNYYDINSDPSYDMAAMYVPNDEALWNYFSDNGSGWQLIQTYYLKTGTSEEITYKKPSTLEDLYEQIDQIPISTLRSLINVIMFKSFVSSVPSKMNKLKDDANEQLFTKDDKQHITRSIMADNGIIYLTDQVYGPADFTSVAAPAYISKTNLVMRWAIYNGYSSKETNYMNINYFAYLKAMQSDFAFFMPSDKGMQYYYDALSFKNKYPRMVSFSYNQSATSTAFPINSTIYRYTPETGTIGAAYPAKDITDKTYNQSNLVLAQADITNRFKDILENHTIVLDGKDEIDTDVDEYYLTKNGAALKVTRGTDDKGKTRIKKVQGGFQLENEEENITGEISADNTDYTEVKGIQYNKVTDEMEMKNGCTYILDSPIIPASKSVYNRLTHDGLFDSPEYEAFYNLCEIPTEGIDVMEACGLVDKTLDTKKLANALKKYYIFYSDYGLDYNVQFFNNYNYTVFVPTADAIEAAHKKGLPYWSDIINEYESHKTVVDGNDVYNLTYADSMRLQAQIIYLNNFIRYHFIDNSVFVDKSEIASSEYVTSSYDNDKGLFCKINVKRNGGVLAVKDANNGSWYNIQGKYNVLARDITCCNSSNSGMDPTGTNKLNGVQQDGASFVVIHQIPGVLNHTALDDEGRYDSNWRTTAAARRYIKRFAIPEAKAKH